MWPVWSSSTVPPSQCVSPGVTSWMLRAPLGVVLREPAHVPPPVRAGCAC
jgi:hypothetical protein